MNEQHLQKKNMLKRGTKDVIKALLISLFMDFCLHYIGLALWHDAGWSQTLLCSIAAPLPSNKGADLFCYEGYIKHMYHFKCQKSPFCSLSPLKHTFQVFLLRSSWAESGVHSWGPPETGLKTTKLRNTRNILFHFKAAIQTQLQTNTLVIEWKKMQCHRKSHSPLIHLWIKRRTVSKYPLSLNNPCAQKKCA